MLASLRCGSGMLSCTRSPQCAHACAPLHAPPPPPPLPPLSAECTRCAARIYYEEPVEFQGHVGVDGGLTDNQPVTDANTVTVSPWAHGEALIRPSQVREGRSGARDREMERQTDRQTDRQTQTDRQARGQIDTHTKTKTRRERERERETLVTSTCAPVTDT
eukprot:735478-Rhodomonas_salina.1